jgi:hypothetical protein
MRRLNHRLRWNRDSCVNAVMHVANLRRISRAGAVRPCALRDWPPERDQTPRTLLRAVFNRAQLIMLPCAVRHYRIILAIKTKYSRETTTQEYPSHETISTLAHPADGVRAPAVIDSAPFRQPRRARCVSYKRLCRTASGSAVRHQGPLREGVGVLRRLGGTPLPRPSGRPSGRW